MADITIEQKVKLIECYYTNGKSKAAAVRAMESHYGNDLNCHPNTLKNLIKKFLLTASMDDRRSENPGRPYEVTTPEVVDKVEAHFEENPKDSIRRAAQVLGLKRESLRVMLKKFLNFHPYKISVHQKLTEAHKAKRVDFSKKVYDAIENGSLGVKKIIFSDEAHFDLTGYVNKQNMRFWAIENPYYTTNTTAHPIRLTAWAAISRKAIYLTTFTETVTGEFYKQILIRRFYPWLTRAAIPTDSWFMQDGATPHRTHDVFESLATKFEGRVIGLGYPAFQGGGIEWPPYSPDLNPCDFFLWGYLKDRVYQRNPKDLNQLESAIKNEVANIDDEMLNRVYIGFLRRLEACHLSGGGHFENIYV
ncbi:uncharacterized protein LOC128388492 [Panonychus citri]|uniref:uncharacterized protein LOC128388492 n=1 Tax=Panonychus citri TaxID=50023 RepID=UPI002307A766|nr:uncharacterized protein LOC128388492 [Panonychus citri]